jgi:hypothetical protein
VELPLEIEGLRRDLRAAECALASAEASRDAAVQELERLRFSVSLSCASSLPEQDAILAQPYLHNGEAAATPSVLSSRNHRSHSSFIDAASSSASAQSLINFSARATPRSATIIPPHTSAPASLAGIGVRLHLDGSGRLSVQESAILLNATSFVVWAKG